MHRFIDATPEGGTWLGVIGFWGGCESPPCGVIGLGSVAVPLPASRPDSSGTERLPPPWYIGGHKPFGMPTMSGHVSRPSYPPAAPHCCDLGDLPIRQIHTGGGCRCGCPWGKAVLWGAGRVSGGTLHDWRSGGFGHLPPPTRGVGGEGEECGHGGPHTMCHIFAIALGLGVGTRWARPLGRVGCGGVGTGNM